jgi:ribonuclease-3
VNDIINIKEIEQILNIKITDVKIFETAFTHRSYLNEHPKYTNPSNERMEFLGDAVLELVVSRYLYNTYPKEEEGVLTNYRSAIVCTPSLAQEALRLQFGEHLLMSNGEEKMGGRTREYILANTFEAVLGAIYLTLGYDVSEKFVLKELMHKMDNIVENKLYKDAKSRFQEIAQEKLSTTPIYKVIEEWGADHEKTFKVGVYLEDKLFGTGEGRSKQKAQQQAAENSIDKLKNL